MERSSTLGYALLGLLAREALSGYDLANIMKQRVRHFWTAQHSQIYPELAKLEAAGLVTHDVERQPGRPDKKVFAITKEGRSVLANWAEEPIERAAVRDEAVLRIYCGASADPKVLIANLEAYAAELDAVVDALEANREMMEGKFEKDIENAKSGRFFGYATLRLGIDATRTRANWCKWLVKRLRSAEKRKPRKAAR